MSIRQDHYNVLKSIKAPPLILFDCHSIWLSSILPLKMIFWKRNACFYLLPNLLYHNTGHSMATANLKKSLELVTNTTAASKYIPWRPLTLKNFKRSFFRLKTFFSVTKKNCPRNNFCSVFYELESKKKFRSDPKFFEIFYLSKFT